MLGIHVNTALHKEGLPRPPWVWNVFSSSGPSHLGQLMSEEALRDDSRGESLKNGVNPDILQWIWKSKTSRMFRDSFVRTSRARLFRRKSRVARNWGIVAVFSQAFLSQQGTFSKVSPTLVAPSIQMQISNYSRFSVEKARNKVGKWGFFFQRNICNVRWCQESSLSSSSTSCTQSQSLRLTVREVWHDLIAGSHLLYPHHAALDARLR